MKIRYILLFSITLTITAYGQNTHLSQLEVYLQKQKDHVVADSIRHIFAVVSKDASDSYRYEYHKDGADTMKYELAFRYDNDSEGQTAIREVARFLCSGTNGRYYHGGKDKVTNSEMKAVEVYPLTVSKQPAITTSEKPNPRLKQLEDCLQRQGYEIGFVQTNLSNGRGIQRDWTFALGAQEGESLATAIDSIRAAFTDLSKEEAESHLYENHKDCADTIEYAVGFFDGKRELQTRNSLIRNRVWFINAREQASFSYQKDCDNKEKGNYMHRYECDNSVPLRSFDAPAFEAHIQPAFAVLKSLKGAATYPVYWRHDKEYKDSLAGGRIHLMLGNDDGSHTGLITGFHYFIPAQYKAETNALYQQLDSLTFDYVNRYPEQLHRYSTSSRLPYVTSPNSKYTRYTETDAYSVQHFPSLKLQGHAYSGDNYTYYFFFYMMEDGLHILSITSKGEGWMPMEWQKLNSWINGKKEYLKGAKQGAKHQAVTDAVATKKWRIDINSMNTMRYGARTVTPDFYLELRGDMLHSYLPYLGQARVSPTLSPSIGLNFETQVIRYKQSMPKSKKYTQLDIDVRTREDSYHYVIELYDSGDATIRVRSLYRDPISFDGTLVTTN